MRLLLATNHLGLGGSESYLLTVAEQLDRLGHDVAVYAPEGGEGAGVAEERAIATIGEAELDGDFDAALVQDGGVSYQLADRCPGVPQLFVAHSAKFDLQAPPQLDGMVGIVVALNDVVAERMRRYPVGVEVIRLRQPIDIERFVPQGELPEVPRRALLLSNAPSTDRLVAMEAACAAAGLELARVGGPDGRAADIRLALARADVVIGYGRSILEAMACGRAAYVYDWQGGDGWVTPETYPAIEATGLAGRSGLAVVDPDRLRDDLRLYSAAMGPVNHDLVVAHHRATMHAEALLDLFQRLAEPPPRPRGQLQEMARLVRLEWRARVEVHTLTQEIAHLRRIFSESEGRVGEAKQEVLVQAERTAEAVRAYESSRSWRVTRPLRGLAHLAGRLWSRLNRAGRRPRSGAGGGGSAGTRSEGG